MSFHLPCLRRNTRAALWPALAALALFGVEVRADEASQTRALAQVQAFIASGDLPAALKAADKASSDSPRDAQARFLRGVVLMDMKRDDEALLAFTQLAQEYPELPDPYNNIALLQARAGHLELARQALETALRNDPRHRMARVNLGQVYLMLAVQSWEHAVADGPTDAPLQRRLEAVRSLLGNPAVAR